MFFLSLYWLRVFHSESCRINFESCKYLLLSDHLFFFFVGDRLLWNDRNKPHVLPSTPLLLSPSFSPSHFSSFSFLLTFFLSSPPQTPIGAPETKQVTTVGTVCPWTRAKIGLFLVVVGVGGVATLGF